MPQHGRIESVAWHQAASERNKENGISAGVSVKGGGSICCAVSRFRSNERTRTPLLARPVAPAFFCDDAQTPRLCFTRADDDDHVVRFTTRTLLSLRLASRVCVPARIAPVATRHRIMRHIFAQCAVLRAWRQQKWRGGEDVDGWRRRMHRASYHTAPSVGDGNNVVAHGKMAAGR